MSESLLELEGGRLPPSEVGSLHRVVLEGKAGDLLEDETYANSCSQGRSRMRCAAAHEEYLAGRNAHGADVSQAVNAVVSGLPLERGRNRTVISELEYAGLDELDARVVTPRDHAGPLVCVESTDPHALVEALAGDGVVTSSRDRALRVSLHLYNSEEDVEAIVRALAKHRRLLAR